MMFKTLLNFALSTSAALVLVACGGAQPGTSATSTGTTGTTPVASIKTAANFNITGAIGPGANTGQARVLAYDSAGTACGSPILTDSAGNFSFTAKCAFPIVLFADLPDGNDGSTLPAGATGEGRKFFNFVSEITKDGQSFVTNLSPTSSAVTMLALGRLPAPGSANLSAALNETRRSSAHAKIQEGLDPIAAALGLTIPDYLTADLSSTGSLGKLLSVVQISLERIESTKQTLIRFHIPSESRQVVLVATDAVPLASTYYDSGLGNLPSTVAAPALQAAAASYAEITSLLSGVSASNLSSMDSCFLHNGSNLPMSMFDVPVGWGPQFISAFENVSLIRYNTYTDFTNEMLEHVNDGTGTLAYISFDFRNKFGLKQRAYTWMIKGSQSVQGCSSTGTGWRILGNQRPVYIKTDTIAFHEATLSQQFGTRRDTYGSGTEHFVYDTSVTPFTHVLINGPGFPSDGYVYLKNPDNKIAEYLFTTSTLLSIRQMAHNFPVGWQDKIIAAGSMKDTKAVVLLDPAIKQITDAYFDGNQNVYTYRFFKDGADLYPSLILSDVLPKRPYLSTEIPVDYFHTVALNLDSLVQSLQNPAPIQVNWSLPLDIRKKQMLPESVFVTRMNCINPKSWPSCSKRSEQYNEYSLGLQNIWDPLTASASVLPEPLPSATLTTFKGYMRMRLLDSLNRPIETRSGMDYTR
jgi:hypothetical protein